jgi:hypothetical protein
MGRVMNGWYVGSVVFALFFVGFIVKAGLESIAKAIREKR